MIRRKNLINRRARKGGFTLVELLLVLVILGVLAAIVIPKFSGRTQQAKETAATTQISSLSTALNAFEVDNGYYPQGAGGLDELMTKSAAATNWRGPYLQQSIVNDPWGNPYVYESPGKHNTTSYDFYSTGPDGRAGTDDDINNWQKEK
ncbi:GspG family T2SS major pseudopilin variant ExeG [soil metagenome]